MAKRYQHVGTLPIVVGDYGRVIPGTKFSCEMDPEQEAWLIKINALRVLEELPPEAELDPAPKDTATWPQSWPRAAHEQVADAKKGGAQ